LCNDIQLQDPTLGSVLDLKIDYDVSAWGDTTVVVYPPYILCNHSGIHLVFGQVSPDLVGSSQVRHTIALQCVAVCCSVLHCFV